MKKTVKILGVIIFFCVCIIFVCIYKFTVIDHIDGVTPVNVIQALKNAGFSETYFENNNIYINSKGMYIDDGYPENINDTTPYKNCIYIRNYSTLDDTIPVLNAIIPMMDESFDNYGAKTVAELKYNSSFTYNDIFFSIYYIPIENENYMNDLNDHNAYRYEEAISIYFG